VRARLRSLVAVYIFFLVFSPRLTFLPFFLPYRFYVAWRCIKWWRVHLLLTHQRHTDVAGCQIVSKVLRCCLCDWWCYIEYGIICRIISLLCSLQINCMCRVYLNVNDLRGDVNLSSCLYCRSHVCISGGSFSLDYIRRSRTQFYSESIGNNSWPLGVNDKLEIKCGHHFCCMFLLVKSFLVQKYE